MKEKFELFMGCLGNGITVCNKAVMEHGDYKKVAHIRDYGKIKWYVDPLTYVPSEELLKIEHSANVQAEKWEKWFSSMPGIKQYEYLLDRVPHNIFMEIVHSGLSLQERISYLKRELYKQDRL